MAGVTLYRWFAASAARYPDAPALEVAQVRLTFAELDAVARALAGRLEQAGAGAGSRVGLLARGSLTAYAGYLATLLLGAVIVPMNPGVPVARNQSVAAAAGLSVVIADAAGGPHLAAVCVACGATPLLADDPRAIRPAPHGAARPGPAGDLAYILFTSGSTGRPKGVPITHANIGAFLAHHASAYDLGPQVRWLQSSELTFDQSVANTFLAWGAGGCVVVPRREELLSLVRLITAQAITHCWLPPSAVHLARRMRSLRPGAMPGLRWSYFGAEQVTLAAARAWHEAAPNSRISNVYGPTEVAVGCVGYDLPCDPAQWPVTSNDAVPIGLPYPGTEYVLLNEGEVAQAEGELCVRGPQRFRGYLDPADNPGRFTRFDGGTACDYSGDGPLTAAYWYRTGDWVRVEAGLLVHVGRVDYQVKIRGHRVELGEIESVLHRHPHIDQVTVIAVTARDGEIDLTAVYTSDRPVSCDELVAMVHATLPAYMLPRRFVRVRELPHTATGKVDRSRLAVGLLKPALKEEP